MNTLINILASAGTTDIEEQINSLSINSIMIASLVLVILLGIAAVVVGNKKYEYVKVPLFVAIAATIILPSLLLMGSTVYVNTISESKGPVHWHTDIEFWVCGQEIELRNPTGFLSNKIGTSTYHEHDDKRIHLEGVVIKKEYDASLEKFMDVTDGDITQTSLVIATEDVIFENDLDGDVPRGDEEVVRQFLTRNSNGQAQLSLENGKNCGENQPAEVQVFLLRYNGDDETYTQTKLEDPARYVMRDESVVPPGDCLIVEFDVRKSSTDRLCKQYGVRDSIRCTEFGVSQFNPQLCNLRMVLTPDQQQDLSEFNEVNFESTQQFDEFTEEIIIDESSEIIEDTTEGEL
jgi:hypothetical protein